MAATKTEAKSPDEVMPTGAECVGRRVQSRKNDWRGTIRFFGKVPPTPRTQRVGIGIGMGRGEKREVMEVMEVMEIGEVVRRWTAMIASEGVILILSVLPLRLGLES